MRMLLKESTFKAVIVCKVFVVGKLLSELALNATPSHNLSIFIIDRFKLKMYVCNTK